MKNRFGKILDIIVYLLFAIGVLIAFSAFWMLRTWPNLAMDELVFQLSQGFSGTGSDMIQNYIKSAGIPSAVIILFMGVCFFRLKNNRILQRTSLVICAACCLFLSVKAVYESVGVEEYVTEQRTESEFIEENYADPKEVSMVFPEQKRNLIYIYLESMEMTYADQESGGAFEENVIPELTQLAKENECFAGNTDQLNGSYALPGTTWTMGGLFAATSGLPLQISIGGNDMDKQDEFFPGVETIGDILAEQGYKNVFLIGSDAVFGGRKLYFQSHGNYEIMDYHYANDNGLIDKDYYVWWGFEDNKLINIAKDKLGELSASEQPFNLTILTVDTHFEDGWICEDCPDTFGDNRYANVMACSSKQIYDFVSWCKEQPWYENTAIVLSGDHLTMDADFCNGIGNYDRRVYTSYINSAVSNAEPAEKRAYSTFDNFPTALAAMGVAIEGDRLGLGTNLFSGAETLTEMYGLDDEKALLKRKSSFMSTLSGITVSTKDVTKDGKTLVDADVRVTGYNEETGMLSVRADDILIAGGAVRKVRFVTENDSGTVYYDGKVNTDGSYSADLYVPYDQLSSTGFRVSAVCERNGGLGGGIVFACADTDLRYIGSLQKNPAGFIDYVNTLDQDRYDILMVTQGNASRGMSDEVQQALYRLGCETDIRNTPDTSYLMIKDGGMVLERSGNQYLEWYGYMSTWNTVILASAGEANGNTSSIMVNDRIYGFREYCPGNDGLNILIWDKWENKAVLSTSFDTSSGLPGADVRISADSENEDSLIISVSDIVNFKDTATVYGIIYDETNPAKKEGFTLEAQEDGSYKGAVNTEGIDRNHVHIRIMAADLSYETCIVRKIDGSLETYMNTPPES